MNIVNKQFEAAVRRRLTSMIKSSDEFFDIEEWPRWARVSFLEPHHKRNERYNLFLFFWRNGLRAETAERWIMFHHNYRQYAYDKNALEDIRGLRKLAELSSAFPDNVPLKIRRMQKKLLQPKMINLYTGVVDTAWDSRWDF